MNIIDWCNNNEGFVNMILSILTVITSIVAIIISIHTAKIPYKKKIAINPIFDQTRKKDKYKLTLYVANTGNKIIGINYIEITYKRCELLGKINFELNEKAFIKPAQVIKAETELIVHEFEDGRIIKKVEITIKDTEGKEYVNKVNFAMG